MTRSTKRLTDAPAAPEHVSATIAEIEQATPAPAPTPAPARQPVPVNVPVNGKGAFRLVKTGDHQAAYQFDPNATQEVLPLPLSSSTRSMLFLLCERNGLDRWAFIAFAEQNKALVRQCERAHAMDGQWSAYGPLLEGFREQAAS